MANANKIHYMITIISVAATLMILSIVYGNLIQEEIMEVGFNSFISNSHFAGMFAFLLFAFGFPVGASIGIFGAIALVGASRRWLLVLFVSATLLAFAAILVPMFFGKESSPAFFGVGGWLILAFVIATIWLWASRRAKLPSGSRVAADLRGGGYLCFAIAAWNLCGVGGMPSFALTPETMLAIGSRNFAVGQMKTVIVLLIVGWGLTALAYYKEK